MDGKTLKQIISDSGRSQKELAEKMGMQPSQWTTYFKQESVTSDVLERVAGLLGMSMGQLYGEAADSESVAKNRQIRELSAVAMQGMLTKAQQFPEDILKTKTYEQCIAEQSVRQAICLVEEFQKQGIDK